MKVEELQGALLDYWVARASKAWEWAHYLHPTMTLDPTFKGVELFDFGDGCTVCRLIPNNPFRQDYRAFSPHTDWTEGGFLMDRARIGVEYLGHGTWKANITRENGVFVCERGSQLPLVRHGDTALVAAMRVLVAGELGEEVPDIEAQREAG